jgi:cysteine dioxygenase
MAHALRDRILASPAGSERALTATEMLALARTVDLSMLDLSAYCQFDTERYARNSVLLNEHVELVIICWVPDQASSIHDHGRSNCLYLVTQGTMQEEMFELNADQRPRRIRARQFERGAITIAAPTDVHRILNPGPENLVTVHIYSPPLDESVTNFTPIPTRKSTTPSC